MQQRRLRWMEENDANMMRRAYFLGDAEFACGVHCSFYDVNAEFIADVRCCFVLLLLLLFGGGMFIAVDPISHSMPISQVEIRCV